MKASSYKIFIIALYLLSGFAISYGQFYNGHQMTFGKSRVQYNNFYWSFYRFDKFDTYFNQYGQELANFTGKTALREIRHIENFFNYTLEKRIIFLIYNKLTDFRQSNIGLVSGNDEYNTGGVTRITDNKVFLYYNGDHQDFERQITASITEVLINEMLYGNNLKENITNSTLINLPEWYIKGLISYVSDNWDVNIENRVKDGILSGKYKKFNRLTGEDAIFAGHSFWKYIAKTYGESIIPNIIYITKINKNSNSGFYYVVGSNLKQLSKDWLKYYTDLYSKEKDSVSLSPGKKLIKRPQKRVYQQVKVSPKGDFIAYTSNDMGKYKVWLYNCKTSKTKKIIRKEHKLDQISDYSFPVLAWHPSGKILTFITEEEGGLKLYYYTPETKTLEKRNLLYFEKVLDYSFSDDGQKMVLSAFKSGQTDIYVHTMASATDEQLTNDLADDLEPRFINDGSQIIFSSNRKSDTLSTKSENEDFARNFDLYIINYPNKSNNLIKVSDAPYVNKFKPLEIKKNEFSYLGDENGILNRYVANLDSAISFVDTTTHYRYLTKTFPVTNYTRNLLDYDMNKQNSPYAEIMFHKGQYNIYQNPIGNIEKGTVPLSLADNDYRKSQLKDYIKTDSLSKLPKKDIVALSQKPPKPTKIVPADTASIKEQVIDINHYVFDKEKPGYKEPILPKIFDDAASTSTSTSSTDSINGKPKTRIYQTSFYTNYMVSQVDFNFLNSSYQSYTGTNYYNPGFNMLFKIGTNDLFEDYKIVGGFRFGGNFDCNEYLLSFENLKKRLDKQIVFHRQAYENSTESAELKTHTHELMYIVKWPFDQVSAVRATFTFRYDRTVNLSIDMQNLKTSNNYKYWDGIKLEYIYDDTRFLGINLYEGTRAKAFGESYWQINNKLSDLFVLGVDCRHYERIHRTLIWASRFAASTSFGRNRLLYYLGGVDNWWTYLSKGSTFDQSVSVSPNQHYAYQAVATDMRGFIQNARNGNSFALLNNEIRFPIIRYFANRPISSNFWSNLQLVGFCDVGSAWTGLSPYSGKNGYDHETISNKSIEVELDSNRDPIIAGFGWGVRLSLLGYFIRLDWARGIENSTILPQVFYFSLSTDF